jgi:hypothetical protein
MMLPAVWTACETGASPLAKHNDMIQAIPPDRADQSLRISVLPLSFPKIPSGLDWHRRAES